MADTMLEKRLAENRWYTSTVQALLREICLDRPNKVAIIFEDKKITYQELQSNIDQCSQALLKLGVKEGDHVAMMPTTCPEFASLYFATLQIGAVINPLNLLWGVIEFNGILQRNEPKIIVAIDKYAGRDYIKLLREVVPDLKFAGGKATSAMIPTLTNLISLSRQGNKYDGFIDFSDFLEGGKGYNTQDIEQRVMAGKGTDIQFICQTSGSTGLSKSALWDHRAPLSTVHFYTKALTFTKDDTFINVTPFYHNSGILALNMVLALAGATIFLNEVFDPEKAIELIDRYEITTTTGFDAHFQAMKRVLDAAGGKVKFTLSKFLAAIQPQTFEMIHLEMCKGKDIKLIQSYAQTENGPCVAATEPDCVDYNIRKYTNGRPQAGVELVIKDIDTGEKLPPEKPGEICYRSPYLFKGYYKQEKETKDSFDAEGYFKSGDYGTFENGYVRFLGRLGGVVKSGGENVSTTYVTSLLLKLFPEEFEDAITIGVPDPYWGSKIISWVRLKSGRQLRAVEDIKAECKGKMANYEIPKEIFQWEGPWPMTPIGKMDLKVIQTETESRLSK